MMSEFLKGSLLKMSNEQLVRAVDEAQLALHTIERCATITLTPRNKKRPAGVKLTRADLNREDLQAQIDYARVLLHRRLVG